MADEQPQPPHGTPREEGDHMGTAVRREAERLEEQREKDKN